MRGRLRESLRLQYNFRCRLTRGAIIAIHPRRYLSKLYPYLADSERHSAASLVSEQTETRGTCATFYGRVYSARVCRNSFIEALHVLHETLATNNCFSANACWYFLISENLSSGRDGFGCAHISGHSI